MGIFRSKDQPDDVELELTMSMVRDHPDQPWDRYVISRLPDFMVEDLSLELPNAFGDWDWSLLSMVIPIDDIRDNPEYPWDKSVMHFNEEFTLEDRKSLHLPHATGRWVKFSSPAHIPWEYDEDDLNDLLL